MFDASTPPLLHTKSAYSIGYGTARVGELLHRAARLEYPAVALTDIENLYGQVELHHAARALGVRAITGVELRAGYGPRATGRKTGRLVLLARDESGYHSLCRIVTARRGVRGDSSATTPDPLRCLETEPEGVFYLSDDPRVLTALREAGVAADDLRFLLVRPQARESQAPAGIRRVADPDVVMLEPGDRELHAMLIAIRRHQLLAAVRDDEPESRSMPDSAALHRLYADAPDAIEECRRVADACTLDLTTPRADFPETRSIDLEAVCRERLPPGEAYESRLVRELEVVRERGLGGYLQVAGTIATWARSKGIAVAGRGSAAGSLVVHLLGLSQVDPVAYGLSFDRFLNALRPDLPDIDLDLPSDRRDEVVEWVFRRFGAGHVAMVAAHQTFGRRGALRAGLTALGMRKAPLEAAMRRLPSDEVVDRRASIPPQAVPADFRYALALIERLIGRMHHLSVHPGGVVITASAITRHAPLERAPKGVLVTQYDMESLKRLGLVKIDLLGNRALAAMEDVRRRTGAPTVVPDGDARTQDTLLLARTIGCFQIETPPMRSALRKLPVRGIRDLMAVLAIVRPGPASGDAKARYIRRATGREAATPPHPRLAALLAPTYGMLLYEEDVTGAIAEMTGWPVARADAMRARLIGAGDDADQLAGLEREFLVAAEQAGTPGPEAGPVWHELHRFAAYSFNKAHAASYAYLAWRSAYLKTHYPTAFACAVLTHYGGAYPLRSVAAAFSRHGVAVLPPHVNRSRMGCETEGRAVRLGLGMIKGLTSAERVMLLQHRPYADLPDLLRRTPLRFSAITALVLSGACDGLDPLDALAYPFAHEDVLARLSGDPRPERLEGFTPRRPGGDLAPAYQALVRARHELRILGVHPSGHPMAALRPEVARAGCEAIDRLPQLVGREVCIGGLVAATRRLDTRAGQIMQFVTLEDETGMAKAVLFPGVYSALSDPVSNPGPFVMSGTVASDEGDVHLVVSSVAPFHERPNAWRARNQDRRGLYSP
jgi:DNA-directed DNA polymerase III PolC